MKRTIMTAALIAGIAALAACDSTLGLPGGDSVAGADTCVGADVLLPPGSDTAASAPDLFGPPHDVMAAYDAAGMEDTGAPPEEDQQDQGDEYDPPGTNPFVVTASDPQSTFGADVDTASYEIFLRDVRQGRLPDYRSVRLEEFVNYFDYDYEPPDPEGEVPFSVFVDASANPFRASTTLLRVGIRGRDVPEEEQRPANLVFLVDVSGSMSAATKLGLVKVVLRETLEVLAPTDTVAIVTYAGNTSVRLEPTPVAQAGAIEAVINGLESGGSTAGAAGLQLAYAQAEAAYIEGGVNHVLLCTDGDFNVGLSGTDELVQFIEQKRRSGITLTVLGFGAGNLNDAMMEAITNAGNGVYGYIGDADQAIDYVHSRLLSTLHFIAQDMKIQVEMNAEYVHAYRLLGYENRAIADNQFTDDKVDAGEVGAGHTVTALYELVPVGVEIPLPEGAPAPEDGAAFQGVLDVQPGELCLVKVRYKDVGASEDDPAYQVDAGLLASEVAEVLEDGDSDLQWAVAVAGLAEILKHSPYGDPADFPKVRVLLEANAGSDADRLELTGLLDTIEGLLGD